MLRLRRRMQRSGGERSGERWVLGGAQHGRCCRLSRVLCMAVGLGRGCCTLPLTLLGAEVQAAVCSEQADPLLVSLHLCSS